jgi:dolichol-phosphate mannosyltransferase
VGVLIPFAGARRPVAMSDALSRPPRITIITPVHNEAENLPRYEKTVGATLFSRAEYEFNILLVDDGSTDNSWELICGMAARDARFRGMRLSRNFGSHIALSAGFLQAPDADALATLACDLQDPPEVILEFLDKWRSGARIVWGHRRTRDDPAWRLWSSWLFTRLVRRFAMPPGSRFATGSFLLVDRRVADCFRQFNEHNRITFALVAWTGFSQEVVEYDRQARRAAQSSWNFAKMMKAMYDTFLGFSSMPVRLITWAGILTSLLAAALALYVLIAWLTGAPIAGWSSLMLGLAGFFAIQFFLTSIMGEYLYRIYAEVTRRPLYFISEETRPPGDEHAAAGR